MGNYLADAHWAVGPKHSNSFAPGDYTLYDEHGCFLCCLTNEGFYEELEARALRLTNGAHGNFLNANWLTHGEENIFYMRAKVTLDTLKEKIKQFQDLREREMCKRFALSIQRDRELGDLWTVELTPNQISPSETIVVNETAMLCLCEAFGTPTRLAWSGRRVDLRPQPETV